MITVGPGSLLDGSTKRIHLNILLVIRVLSINKIYEYIFLKLINYGVI